MSRTVVRTETLTYTDDGELENQHILSEIDVDECNADTETVRAALRRHIGMSPAGTKKIEAIRACDAFDRITRERP